MEYEYEVVYKAGKSNANALSRNPATQNIFPVEILPESDSEHSIFSPEPPFEIIEDKNNRDTPSTLNDESTHTHSDKPDDDYTDNASSIISASLDNITESDEDLINQHNVIEIKDNFSTRKDNLVVFIT